MLHGKRPGLPPSLIDDRPVQRDWRESDRLRREGFRDLNIRIQTNLFEDEMERARRRAMIREDAKR